MQPIIFWLHNTRSTLLLCGLVLTSFMFFGHVRAEAGSQPNIILIMADDLGVECLGSYGGLSYRTPHLDQLAKQGLQFNHAYAQPLCTNTRVQLMTGKYNNRNWLYFGTLKPEEKTFGHALQAAGYDTCLVGKWQLHSYDPLDYPGAVKRRGTGMRVEKAGFNHFLAWHIDHTEDKGPRYADPRLNRNGTEQDFPNEYGPDKFTDEICNYITSKRESERPFFVYYPMALPHWPMVPTPRSDDWSQLALRHSEDTKYFPDMVEYMDRCVGRIVDTVDQLGLGEKTLILFYSDNGTHLKITSQTRNGPVQGGKGLTTAAGTHVPMIARWTGHLAPGMNNDLIDSTDFFPTLVEASGAQPAAEELLDGISFYSLLENKPRVKPRRTIFSHYDPRPGWDKDQFSKIRFARTKRYKLYDDGKFYDVEQDRLETNPFTPEPGSRQDNIRQRLQRLLTEMPNPETPPRD